jgi:membrane protease YdiL (CAAX protease family)
MESKTEMKGLGLSASLAIYVPAAILMYCMTQYMIPFLTKATGQEPILFWFIVAALGVFTPLVITAFFILKSEGYTLTKATWRERLRFRGLTKSDGLKIFVGLLFVGMGSVLVMKLLELLIGKFEQSPSFMTFEPLTPGRYWLLLVWLPYFFLNIMGEEFLWRGVMLPRQEITFGKNAWMIHGSGWALFHIAFGWKLLLTMLPLIFIQSYVVQKTRNSWAGVIMHGGINGPSFVAIFFGLI